MKRTQGFTLVEIAIVLVIIGLLLGGILKGQEMITQAKIKNLIADFSGVSAAYHGYQDRYRAIPGDDPGALARWAAPAVNGNGNGVVAGTYNNACALAIESCSFWDHLRRSGFVAGTGPLQPFNAVTGFIGVQTGNAAGAAALGGFVSLLLCSANIPDKMAIAVDTQMDDSDARTGTVRGQLHVGGPNPTINNTADAANYAETGTNVYTLCRTL